jgi:hypothetical protein
MHFILGICRANSGVKKIQITFENLVKDVFYEALFGFFLQNWKILIFFKENSEIYLKIGQKVV